MRFIKIIFCLILPISFSCRHNCTEIYVTVPITISDQNGNKVALDDFYSIRLSNNDTVEKKGDIQWEPGSYRVVSDSYQEKLENKTDDFRFIGIINDSIVINEIFKISADECHIKKVSGNSNVTIQL